MTRALIDYAASGGCICKINRIDLQTLLRPLSEACGATPDDDAAVRDVDAERLLLMSTDFQPPITNDTRLAAEIAAKNAFSDIYACGADPQWFDIIMVLPDCDQQLSIGEAAMDGFVAAALEARAEIVGGHTIEGPAPLFGAAVRSIAPRRTLKRKSGARPGDYVLLTKPIGTGLALSAARRGLTDNDRDAQALATLLRLNDIGALLGGCNAVTAMTDVTGFGLLGHADEVACASNVGLALHYRQTPIIAGALRAAREGFAPALAAQNLAGILGLDASSLTKPDLLVLSDPQTNGPLLFTAAPAALGEIHALCHSHCVEAHVIGEVFETNAATRLVVRP